VNRRRVLVGLVIEGQSGGHGVPPNDLSSKPGEPHTDARHQAICRAGRVVGAEVSSDIENCAGSVFDVAIDDSGTPPSRV
jgi:hypothetical protein